MHFGGFHWVNIQLFHRYHLHELAGHYRLVFLQSPPRFCFPMGERILLVPALGLHALIEE
jgi:hypothetical protein